MTDQLFTNSESTPTPTPVTTTTSDNPYADLLRNIKNEDGNQKYDTIQKALEALSHSQTYIPQIKSQLTERENELERVRSELSQRESLEAVVQRLSERQAKPEGSPPVPNGLDEQAVLSLVQKFQQQTDAQRQATANTDKVQSALVGKFGDKAKEVIEAKARELGSTPAELGALASKNPEMVLALFNTPGQSSPRPTTGGIHLPYDSNAKPELKAPEKSLMGGSGATDRARAEFMKAVREKVYRENGISS